MNDVDDEIMHLMHAVDGDDNLAHAVAVQFVALGESLPERLEATLVAGDLGAAARVAHEIKGMAAMLGARRLAAAARAIESAGPAVLERLPLLRAEWRRTGGRLQRFVAGLA